MKKLLVTLVFCAASLLGFAHADQPTFDFDFGALLFGPPTGNDQQTTLAVDGVNGNDANAGTLYAPKRTLLQTIASGSVLGLYRGSAFRASLPLPAGTTHGIVVQDVTLGSTRALPVVSALDPVTNPSPLSNYDNVYTYNWTPGETLSNDGYNNVYVIEINTATEISSPVASRRRMLDLNSADDVESQRGSAWVQMPGTRNGQSGSAAQWKILFHPSDDLPPGKGTYRYEVVARVQPANWGAGNTGEGAMSGLQLVGGGSGYGSLGGPLHFSGDRLAILHATTHGAVIGGGTLSRSVFYEMGDLSGPSGACIQLAWYTDDGGGQSWSMQQGISYGNVGDRLPNFVISHVGTGANYARGDISDWAFVGARWSDGSLRGTALDYVNVNAGTIDRVYVQGVADAFGNSMPDAIEVKDSVFRQVNHTQIDGSFHDNIVAAESASNAINVNYRAPISFQFHGNAAAIKNNLIWAHGLRTAINNDDQAIAMTVNSGVTGGSATHNILVVDPATPATPAAYFQGSLPAGITLDYNLVIFTAPFYAGGTRNNFTWADYLANNPTFDRHSLFVDLSGDPRGLKAVFADPADGDFRWAGTDVSAQCAAFCQANNVGPATVTTHWPLVPTVDAAVAAISLLPPRITSAGAITFTDGANGQYKITTDLDGTPDAPTNYSGAGQPPWLSMSASSGWISGTPPTTGNFSMSVGATNKAGTGNAALGITVKTAYVVWQGTYFTAADLNDPSISGPYATPAGDGIPNLLKYALGLDPKTNGTGALPRLSLTTVGNSGFLTITYNKSLAASDLTYAVEVSGDLRVWSSGANDTVTVSAITNPAGTTQTVVQRDLTSTSNARQRFIG